MAAYKARLESFEKLLEQEVIDMTALRKLTFNGIPEEKKYRPICWRLLLNYLPSDKKLQNEVLNSQRMLYNQFVEELVISPGTKTPADRDSCPDHPLNCSPDSEWNTFFKDNEVLSQIDKDVRRLNPEISFFQRATEYPAPYVVQSQGYTRLHTRVQFCTLSSSNVERKGLGPSKISVCNRACVEDYVPLDDGAEAHWEVVERILFLYAKLNPGQGYVQGMNEIIGPIYYCYACDSSQWKQYAEADSFFSFTNLMSEIRDFFIKTLDEAETGIGKLMSRVMDEVRSTDFDAYSRLKQQQLYPQYFAFRWLTLLLSQEFPLPDVLRIWDSLFSDESRFEFLVHVCCAMIVLVKDRLIENDFSSNVKLLQNYPSVDVQIVLNKAVELSKKRLPRSDEK